MFFRVLLGVHFLLTPYTYAMPLPVLIRAPQTTLVEFSAYSETEPVKTYIQHQLDKIKKTPRPVNLRSLLKQAQMDFLSHEPNHSKKSFRAIVDHVHAFDWNKEERKIIFYSLFRLAQLEKNTKKQAVLLKEALTFSMGLKVDTTLFPPPITNQYLKIKKSATFVSLNLKQLFPKHSVVIINGRIYSHQKEITLPYGSYRVRALSASHKGWTQTLSLSRLISKRLNTPALVSGSCKNPTLKHKAIEGQNIRILFPNFCVWDSSLQIAKEDKALSPVNMPVAQDLKEPKEESHYEEWIWLGVALVIGGTTIWALTRGDNKPSKEPPTPVTKKPPKPTVKIGF